MKYFFSILLIGLVISSASFAQEETKTEPEYEMKNYFLVILKKGPHRSQDSVSVQKIQKGHLDNIGRLAKEGKINVAGPFLDNGDLRRHFYF